MSCCNPDHSLTDHVAAEGQLLFSPDAFKLPFSVRLEALASSELIALRQAASLVPVHADYSSHLYGEKGVTALGINLAPELPVSLVLSHECEKMT